MSKRNSLKIDIIQIPDKKKKRKRHPAGGFYWGPDHPGGTPKKYNPGKPPTYTA